MHSEHFWSTFGLVFLLPDFSIIQHCCFIYTHPTWFVSQFLSSRCGSQGCVAYSSESPRRRFAPSFTTSHSDGSDDKTRSRWKVSDFRRPENQLRFGSWNLIILQGFLIQSPVVIPPDFWSIKSICEVFPSGYLYRHLRFFVCWENREMKKT